MTPGLPHLGLGTAPVLATPPASLAEVAPGTRGQVTRSSQACALAGVRTGLRRWAAVTGIASLSRVEGGFRSRAKRSAQLVVDQL